MKKTIPHLLLLMVLLAGCTKEDRIFYTESGKKPIYLPISELQDIKSDAPRAITQTGTIFLRDTLFFVLEQHQGIHVYNLKDSLNTINLTFLKIPAITDFTINGNRLYADSWRDLVVIDISNLLQIQEISRIPGVIQPPLYPPLYDGVFECVDESMGAVIGWEDAYLGNARCITTN
jgi:hypothetical protein